jgi:hypothetical protein
MPKVSQTLQVLIDMRAEMRGLRAEMREIRDETRGLRADLVALQQTVVAEAEGNRAAFSELAQLFRTRKERSEHRLDNHERRIRALERRSG